MAVDAATGMMNSAVVGKPTVSGGAGAWRSSQPCLILHNRPSLLPIFCRASLPRKSDAGQICWPFHETFPSPPQKVGILGANGSVPTRET